MRIVLDIEIAQAEPESPPAGVLLGLAKQLAATAPAEAELLLVLNSAFPGTIEPLRGEFYEILPQSQLRVWHSPQGMGASESVSRGLRLVAERLYQAFIAEMQADLVIIPGLTASPDLFKGSQDAQVISLSESDLSQMYALEESAERLWEQARQTHVEQSKHSTPKPGVDRPQLAYVSPLPQEQTGIGYYSAELLPELAQYYEIDVIVAQDSVEDDWINANCGIRSVEWFYHHGHEYDRVVYQFGNSRFHAHMWDLIEKIPGLAVVHDLYLGGAIDFREGSLGVVNALPYELYSSHGYDALKPIIHGNDRAEAVRRFPCSYSLMREARGVIVHSRHAQELAAKWYGERVAERFHVIPHLRRLPEITPEKRRLARERLGIDQNAFLICSFGVVNKTKLPHRLFGAWQSSRLSHAPNARLVFVGDTPDEHGRRLREEVDDSIYWDRISFTGWTKSETFQDYLAAADVAVQLRTNSRGETSGTVLDCMAHGVATICNAHGSFAEVPDEGVWKLEDRFDNDDLVNALDTLWQDAERRQALGQAARSQVQRHYAPQMCGELYFRAIEEAYCKPSRQRLEVVKTAVEVLPKRELNEHLAACLGTTLPVRPPQKQLLVDVSVVAREDLRTGVQRVVRSILNQLMNAEIPGIRVEPVYTTPEMSGYFYAREFTQQFIGGLNPLLPDEPVEASSGDIFLGLDLHGDGVSAQNSFFLKLRDNGVKIYFVVHDLLPVTNPEWFTPPDEKGFENWLHCITQFDGAICVSQTTADELSKWLSSRNVQRHRPYQMGVAHNGADIHQSVPSMGLPEDAEEVLAKLRSRPSFLMVGTVEPRKGVTQVLDAFEVLWQQGHDINLVLVGKHGWNIDELAERLEQHEENNNRLFWLQGISDEYLERVYADSTCLIAGSEGEGFGLPLIEAAQHEIPILARDIPVFREVAGEYADYFTAESSEQLSIAVAAWYRRYQDKQHATSAGMPFLTWADSAQRYLKQLLD